MQNIVILLQTWTDELLKWDSEEYGGVMAVLLPPEKIWTPDIRLYNK